RNLIISCRGIDPSAPTEGGDSGDPATARQLAVALIRAECAPKSLEAAVAKIGNICIRPGDISWDAPGDPGVSNLQHYHSSTIATARTGAPVVPTHLTGKTAREKPCERPISSRLHRFSRCQYGSSFITRCASQSSLRSNIAQTGGSRVIASIPIIR